MPPPRPQKSRMNAFSPSQRGAPTKSRPSLVPFVCIPCRASFKRPTDGGLCHRPCNLCGKPAVRVDVRFRTPKKSDDREWKKVAYLFEHGFYFQKIYRMVEPGVYLRVNYPRDLKEAKAFVAEHHRQAIVPQSTDTTHPLWRAS